ncbi:hypothetical protein GQ53DRAFT_466695 [Thozetella sp. PMI_491]|nr:hypothetical protein GQ53DRAFT_466695 [Thozetella sp. PMI_491]
MRRLAADANIRMTDGSRRPPGVDEKDLSTIPIWILFHAKRLLNKLVWRPATPETKVLADLVSQLRREAETRLGGRIKSAGLSTPEAVRITRHEIRDIFDYLGIEDLVREKWPLGQAQLFSVAGSMAGYGLGLCENYTNAYSCGEEEYHMPGANTIKLDLSSHVLAGALALERSVRARAYRHSFIDFELGLNFLPISNEDEYWDRIANCIREFIGSSRVERILLGGKYASEPRFIDAVRSALPLLPPLHLIHESIEEEHLLYMTSMGMAELSKRRLEGMEHCWLPEECRDRKGGDNDVREL